MRYSRDNPMTAEDGTKPSPSSSIFDTALAIAQQNRETLRQLREALEQGDDATAIKLARVYCGLDMPDEKRDRVN